MIKGSERQIDILDFLNFYKALSEIGLHLREKTRGFKYSRSLERLEEFEEICKSH